MSLRAFMLRLGLSACLIGCADQGVFPVADAGGASVVAKRAALVARLHAKTSFVVGQNLTLQWEVECRRALPAAVTVVLTLPSGVELLEGELRSVLSPCAGPRSDSRSFMIRAQKVPPDDVIVSVDAHTSTFGFRNIVRYGFGRPAPSGTPIVADGPEMSLHGRSFGRSVDATKTLRPTFAR